MLESEITRSGEVQFTRSQKRPDREPSLATRQRPVRETIIGHITHGRVHMNHTALKAKGRRTKTFHSIKEMNKKFFLVSLY